MIFLCCNIFSFLLILSLYTSKKTLVFSSIYWLLCSWRQQDDSSGWKNSQFQIFQPLLLLFVIYLQDFLGDFCWIHFSTVSYFLNCEAQNRLKSPDKFPKVLNKGPRITFLDLLATLLLIQLRTHLSTFAVRAHCWFMVSSSTTSLSFSFLSSGTAA